MKDTIETVLKELGADGIQAFYVYLFVDYLSLWIIFGLTAWGIRTVWSKRSEL